MGVIARFGEKGVIWSSGSGACSSTMSHSSRGTFFTEFFLNPPCAVAHGAIMSHQTFPVGDVVQAPMAGAIPQRGGHRGGMRPVPGVFQQGGGRHGTWYQ